MPLDKDDIDDMFKEFELIRKRSDKSNDLLIAFVLHVGLARIACAVHEHDESAGIRAAIDELTYALGRLK